jgi:nocturnin
MLARGLSSAPRFGGFTKTPRACLDFHAYRKLRVLEEVLRFAPDVVAVEECDHFRDFLQPAMDQFGYDGVFQPKRDAPGLGIWRDSMGDADRRRQQPFFSDGCALFWKRATLRGVASGAVGYDSGKEADGVLWGQVGLYARLALVQKKNGGGSGGGERRTFVVAATHLKSKASPENEARRVEQISQLLTRLEDERRDAAEPVVVMGDFNTDPGLDLYKHVTGDGGRALDLDSAYALGSPGRVEPAYTTCKERKAGVACHTIDYILVPRSTAVEALLSVPPLADLSPGMLPNWNYPSDHLAIGADLVLAL